MHRDASPGDTVNGLVFRKPATGGLWGVWTPPSPEKKTKHHFGVLTSLKPKAKTKPPSTPFKAKPDKANRKPAPTGSSLSEFAQWPHPEARFPAKVERGLSHRGLDPDLARDLGFRHVTKGQSGLPLTAGVNPNGEWAMPSGLLCPGHLPSGELAGFQLKPDRPYGPKYLWLGDRGNGSSHIKYQGNTELPLARFGAPAGQTDEVWLCEGFLKPGIAHARLGRTFLGAAGGNFTSSPKQLRDHLKGVKRVIIAPDGGTNANPHVSGGLARLIDTLTRLDDVEVLIADWGQLWDKQAGDIDEIPERPENLLTVSQYWQTTVTEEGSPIGEKVLLSPMGNRSDTGDYRVLRFHRSLPKEVMQSVIGSVLDDWGADPMWSLGSVVIDGDNLPSPVVSDLYFGFRRSKTPVVIRFGGLELNYDSYLNRGSLTLSGGEVVSGRYFGDTPKLKTKLTVLRGRQGTGKTQSIRGMIDESLGVLAPTHRISLSGFLAEAFNCEQILDVCRWASPDSVNHLAGCVDSFWRYPESPESARVLQNSVVVLDETRQVLRHLLFGQTEVAKRRSTILDRLRFILVNAKHIIISDADITDLEVKIIAELGEVAPGDIAIYRSEYQPAAGRELVNHETTESILEAIRLSVAKGDRLWVSLTGQRVNSTLSTQTLERWLSRLFPEVSILRIDSESHGDKEHPAYQACSAITAAIDGNQVILASPTVSTGVSVPADIKFDRVFGIFTGVLHPEDTIQSLERVRCNAPREVYYATSARQHKNGNGATRGRAWLEGKNDNLHRALYYSLDDLSQAEDNLTTWTGRQSMGDWVNLAAAYAALENSLRSDYRQMGLSLLSYLGYEIESSGASGDTDNKNQVKEVKEQAITEHYERVAVAAQLTHEDADKLSQQTGYTQPERDALQRYRVLDSVGASQNPGQLGVPAVFATLAKDYDDRLISKYRLIYEILAANDVYRAISGLAPQARKDNRFLLDNSKAKLAALEEAGAYEALEQVGIGPIPDEAMEALTERYEEALQSPGCKQYLSSPGRGRKGKATVLRVWAETLGLTLTKTRKHNGAEYELTLDAPSWVEYVPSVEDPRVDGVSGYHFFDALLPLFRVWLAKDLGVLESIGETLRDTYPERVPAQTSGYQDYRKVLMSCRTYGDYTARLTPVERVIFESQTDVEADTWLAGIMAFDKIKPTRSFRWHGQVVPVMKPSGVFEVLRDITDVKQLAQVFPLKSLGTLHAFLACVGEETAARFRDLCCQLFVTGAYPVHQS